MKLTDEELAAFAAANKRTWRGYLATVDETSVETLLESVRRGGASLYAREVDPVETNEPVASEVRNACGLAPVVRAYGAVRSELDRPLAVVAEVFATGSGNVLIDVASDGVHEFQIGTPAEAASFVLETCRHAFSEGFGDRNHTFVVIDGTGDDAAITVVSRGSHESSRARPKESGGFESFDTVARASLDESAILPPSLAPAG